MSWESPLTPVLVIIAFGGTVAATVKAVRVVTTIIMSIRTRRVRMEKILIKLIHVEYYH